MSNADPNPIRIVDAQVWDLLDALVDGPLHPGGELATGRLLDRADVGPGTRLLDLGCGSGYTVTAARDRGARAVGLDRRPGDNVDVVGSLDALPVSHEAVDVVTAECVLCLASDLEAALGDIRRLLRSNGRFAFSDVVIPGSHPDVAATLQGLLCLDGVRDPTDLVDRVEAAGFRVVESDSHHDELLEMRDRIMDSLDMDRIAGLRAMDLGDELRSVDDAVAAGDIDYRSYVATLP